MAAAGSTGAIVSAIETEEPDGKRRTLVLHQYGAANLRADPHAASHEYRLLGVLVRVDLAAFTGELAAFLAAMHGAGMNRADVPFLADVRDDTTRMMGTRAARDSTFSWAAAVLEVLAAAWPPRLLNPPAVLHGDYWPGNVLWRDGRLAGVVDWEDALFGDPLADLAVTRLEVGGLYGLAAMDLLQRLHSARSGVRRLRPEEASDRRR